jgi:hypothetical protein
MSQQRVEVLLRLRGEAWLPWAIVLHGRRVSIHSLGRSWQEEHREHFLISLEGKTWELVHDMQEAAWYLRSLPGEMGLV